MAAHFFPGDIQWKNFGLTRQGKVVFHDAEIEYFSDCNFRHVPTPDDATPGSDGLNTHITGLGNRFTSIARAGLPRS